MERRFNEDLRRHEELDYAHSAMRHTWINEVFAPKWVQLELERQQLLGRIVTIEEQLRLSALAHATEIGEARANRRILRWGFSALALLITVFGAAILARLWGVS